VLSQHICRQPVSSSPAAGEVSLRRATGSPLDTRICVMTPEGLRSLPRLSLTASSYAPSISAAVSHSQSLVWRRPETNVRQLESPTARIRMSV